MLCTLHIIISGLNQFQKNVLHILTYITGLCQSCRICDCKRNIDHACQCLCQKCLTGTSRSQHKNITLLKFHTQIISCKHTLVMIIYCNREHLLCLILSDHIIVQKCLHLLRLYQIDILFCRRVLALIEIFFVNNFCTDIYTLIADICAIWSRDQSSYLILCFAAKRAANFSIILSCHNSLLMLGMPTPYSRIPLAVLARGIR